MACRHGMVGEHMTTRILLLAGIKKQKGSLAGILFLMILAILSLTIAVTIYVNAGRYVSREMERVGYGDLTVWVSGYEDLEALQSEITSMQEIDQVQAQPLIFADYDVNDIHSDNEGELLAFTPNLYEYHIFNADLDGYIPTEEVQILPGEIYLSPVMASGFRAKVGDTIEFQLGRDGTRQIFTVAGYFEDPFMGSSMIDMKSFLISPEDYQATLDKLHTISDFNVTGREGAMLHIFSDFSQKLSITELNQRLVTKTSIAQYMEMNYSKETIQGFMLILQNVVIGFFIGFSVLLLLVILIVAGNSIRNSIRQQARDIGILKTFGCLSVTIWKVKILEYMIPVITGILLGVAGAIPLVSLVNQYTVISSGMLIPANIPVGINLLLCCGVTLILSLYLLHQTKKVTTIRPIQAIQRLEDVNQERMAENRIYPKALNLSLAIRQLLTGWRHYTGVCLVMFLLTVFLAVIGKLDAWVGPQGEGLMNAFSVAEHDIGVQPMSEDFDMQAVEERIKSHTEITDTYRLAMQTGSIDGVELTINVLDDPGWFHVLQGSTADEEDEILVTRSAAEDLKAEIGDEVTVSTGGSSDIYRISGIYECANSMGANVGMSMEGYSRIADISANIWCTHYLLADGSLRDVIMDELMRFYQIDADIHNNSWSGLEGIIGTLHALILCMYAIAACMIGIVIALSGSKVLSFEQRTLSICKSIGFTSGRLRLAFGIRYGLVAMLGAIIGTIVNAAVSDMLVGNLLKHFGIGSFHAQVTVTQILGSAGVIMLLVFLFAILSSGKIKKISVTALLQEI